MLSPLLLSLALLAITLVRRRISARRRLPLPPGPPGLPLVGNMFDIPSVYPWRVYHRWAEQLDSDVVHLSMAGRSILIIDKFDALNELLERRSGIYSSRPPMSMMADLAGWGWAFSVMPYGSRWRARRRLMHQSFHFQAAKQFRPQQVEAARSLLKGFRETPDNFADHVQLFAARVMFTSIYGHDLDSPHHPYVVDLEKAMGGFVNPKLAGIRAIEFFPFLKHLPSWMPGAGFKRDAEEWRSNIIKYMEAPMKDARDQIDAGSAKRSFVSENLEGHSQSLDHYQLIKHVSATILGASFETTASSLVIFIIVMGMFPEVQRRAQAELDTVLHGELPSFEDEDALPYIRALMMELLRWNPTLPASVPHYVHVEDEYNGYTIPANTIVLANLWAILRDEKLYPDPHSFNPGRFLDANGCINPTVRDPLPAAFGSGRRICPGRHFAESALWITMSSILTAFDIGAPMNDAGELLNPSTAEFTSGMVSAPKPFKCKITPRSAKAAKLVDAIDL